MYKCDNDMSPELFADMLIPVCNIHNYDTRKSTGYHLWVGFHSTNTRMHKVFGTSYVEFHTYYNEPTLFRRFIQKCIP